MSTPMYCSSCGYALGVGRFCTNCGRPVPGRHPEARPTAGDPGAAAVLPPTVEPTVPPPIGEAPPAARFPLYAEEQPSRPIDPATVAPPTAVRPAQPPPPSPPTPPPSPQPTPQPTRGRRALLPWLIVALLVALIGGGGLALLLGSGGDEQARGGSSSTPADPSSDDPGDPDQPDQPGTDGPVPAPDPDDVIDLTANVSAEVPRTAPPSRDRDNRPVRFVARNMWDGDPRTAWRSPGDATGSTLTFELGQEAVITKVGLINGYAKRAGPVDWYVGNRRILAVQWEFDDGTRVTQDLLERQAMQSIEVGPVRSQTITLHLVTVSPPGGGPNGRDFTAISEVRFVGAPD